MESERRMTSLYGDIPDTAIVSNIDDLISQVFKLLPYREDGYEQLDYHFSSVLFRIEGMSELFPDTPEFVTVLSLLQAAQNELCFRLYRKAILDSCAILKKIQENINE